MIVHHEKVGFIMKLSLSEGKSWFCLCRSDLKKHDVLLIGQTTVLNHIVSRFDIIGILGNGPILPMWQASKIVISLSP